MVPGVVFDERNTWKVGIQDMASGSLISIRQTRLMGKILFVDHTPEQSVEIMHSG